MATIGYAQTGAQMAEKRTKGVLSYLDVNEPAAGLA